jgi:hypothetical protein
MAEENQQQEQQHDEGSGAGQGGGGASTAVKAAAAAAATGVAAFAAKKALSGRGGSNGHSSNGGSPSSRRGDIGSALNNVLSGGWEAARDALVPAAEDAAGAAGEYLAHSGPDVIRERIVPRFIESFNEARGES